MGIRLGIGGLKIGQGSTGVDWSSYWATHKPTLLTVVGQNNTEISFAWTDNSAGDVSFKVYKSTDGVNYAADGTTVAGDTTYTATGLTAGNLYYFYVVGVKDENESDPTNIYDTRFKITVDTTKAGSANTHFVLPCVTGGYNAYVDWGDGGAEQNITGTPGNVDHTYAESGTYQVKIRGVFPFIYFANAGDKAKVMSLDNWGNIKWAGAYGAFYGCANMEANYIDCPNATESDSTGQMFAGCTKFNGKLTYVSTKLTSCAGMFLQCTAFNSALIMDTSKVTNMNSMFHTCLAFNQSLSGFNTSKVTDFRNMFQECTAFKQDISHFSVAAVVSAANLGYMLLNSDINVAGTTTNYDSLLNAWAAADVPNSLTFHGGNSKYGAAGQDARASLIADDLWSIADGGFFLT